MRRLLLHILLFGLTVGSTVLVGGPWYCVSIMTILLAHELGLDLGARLDSQEVLGEPLDEDAIVSVA